MPKGSVSILFASAGAEQHTFGHQKGNTEHLAPGNLNSFSVTMVTFWSSLHQYCHHHNPLKFPVASVLASIDHHC